MTDKRRAFILCLTFFLPLTVFGQDLQTADSLLQRGKHYDQLGRYPKAEHYYKRAYHIFRNFDSTRLWMKTGKEYASAMVYQSKYEKAMRLYRMLLQVDHPSNDVYNQGDLYNSMGWATRRAGHLNKALSYYQKALPLAKKSGDDVLIGIVYDNMGSIYKRKGNYQKALEFSQQALLFFNRLGNEKRVAIALGNIGSLYKELGLYDQSLSYYKSSKEMLEEDGNLFLRSSIYNSLGNLQFILANYDQALIAHHKSLEYAQKTGVPNRIANSYNNIGLLYKRLGNYEQAQEYYRLSLNIKKENSSARSTATTTHNLGQLLWRQGKTEEASTYFTKAFNLRKKLANPRNLALSLNSMIKLAIQHQNYEEAHNYTRKLKTIADTTGNRYILNDAFHYLGRISEAERDQQAALKYYKKAYNYSQQLPHGNQISSLKQLALQFHRVNSDSAIFYGQLAVNLIEKSRLTAGATAELKSGYFKKHFGFYTRLADWVIEYYQDTPRAFQLVEQAKARAFTEELAQSSQKVYRSLPEEIRIERHLKQQRIDSLYTVLERSNKTNKYPQLSEQIRQAELDLSSFENKLAQQFPQLNRLNSSAVISLRQAQNILDGQTAVIEYALAGEKLLLFFITKDAVQVRSLTPDNDQSIKKKLTAQIDAFRDAIISNASRDQLQSKSDVLYQSLLAPFEEALPDYQNLIIVPDGALAYLPFEALRREQQYLIENYRIKYIPSLTSLTLLEDPASSAQNELLAVSASNFSTVDERPLSGSHLANLPSTVAEVDSIASNFASASLLKNEAASEEALKQLIQQNQYRYVHLATHGLIDENQPARSGLAFSPAGNLTATSKEDGILRSSEILGMNIQADMVVLSACNTGLGEVVGGEGMLGMQRSLFYAGTSTVVVSLWNVYDRSTAAFMNEFYKNLLSGKPEEGWIDYALRWVGWDSSIPFGKTAIAMRQTKLKMISHPLFNHPVYWAPFIVVGR
ncbi:MAG TPA: CHAT domain-containing tetratricopeptide repeat protein [Fodinibius sp.]|nr:CHAT domain-containing tetratricopeptide repeat protein [Fodinibius sp.]